MTELKEKNGSCCCGQVTIKATPVSSGVGACHCQLCQKWSGGAPYMAVDLGTNVDITGTEHISTFNSSEWAERGFCKNCGTNLYYKLKETGQYIAALGLFDDQEGLVFDHQIFIDRKSKLYSFNENTENMTEKEFINKYFS